MYSFVVFSRKTLIFSLLLSIAIHLFVLAPFFKFNEPKLEKVADKGTGNDSLKIRTIQKSSIPKYQRKSVKVTPQPKTLPQQESVTTTPNKKVSLDQLSLDKKRLASPPDDEGRIKVRRITKAIESGIPLTNIRTSEATKDFVQQEQQRYQKVLEYQSHQQKKDLLERSNLNFHFIPPEGMKDTEFNDMSKILYSFKKRMFESYINSLLTSYEQVQLERPLIRNAMHTERHLLTGKITFDKMGNIMQINILKSSSNDDIHHLFDKTLQGINSLPNPPKMLLQGRDEFVVYYQFSINQ